ncbi:MAG: 8-amino-7-oxononanoate synthase [Muribaculaceae bacterium]|nr:8-amino-7-oxononanoate synthase [Muribaculaceae bacterium]
MRASIELELRRLAEEGNLRKIAEKDMPEAMVDLSSNDYLGLAERRDLRDKFLGSEGLGLTLSASASRLLARSQKVFTSFERTLAEAYGGGRKALLFNSGYHANMGLIAPLCGPRTMVIADKLVHASIIDGMKLSGAGFERFRHNDTGHLERLLKKCSEAGMQALIIVESIYSMDGDRAPLEEIAMLKRTMAPEGWLYVDEAHAVGVEGDGGLGLAKGIDGVDIIVGTLGKALASAGAYAIMEAEVREWMVNRSRSFIFSTALPPLQVAWSEMMFRQALTMDSERAHLRSLGRHLEAILRKYKGGEDARAGHIMPLIAGDPKRAVALSEGLRADGFCVLPIRRPTVPPGTDRLRLSLSAALTHEQLDNLDVSLSKQFL